MSSFEKRLIDVNKVIDQMQQCIDESPYERDSIASYTFGAIIECLKKEPTVDAVEVVHGHWCWEGRFKACSKCGSHIDWDDTLGANHWKFCPYCGAKMDGDGNG